MEIETDKVYASLKGKKINKVMLSRGGSFVAKEQRFALRNIVLVLSNGDLVTITAYGEPLSVISSKLGVIE